MCLVRGLASWMHKYDEFLMKLGLALILLTVVQWWRDVSREATFQGKHTQKVEDGMRLGMVLFISSEVFFFVAFFWAFFHASLSPSVELGSVWPPVGIRALNPLDVPLLNTTILLARGVSITWAHIALIENKWIEALLRLLVTARLGVYFTALQAMEYVIASFTMADRVYGRTFFVATGFHGLHVIIGTTFIATMLYRHLLFHFTSEHHFGFEASA